MANPLWRHCLQFCSLAYNSTTSFPGFSLLPQRTLGTRSAHDNGSIQPFDLWSFNWPCFSGIRYFWRSSLLFPIQQLHLKMKLGPFVRSSTVTTTCKIKRYPDEYSYSSVNVLKYIWEENNFLFEGRLNRVVVIIIHSCCDTVNTEFFTLGRPWKDTYHFPLQILIN